MISFSEAQIMGWLTPLLWPFLRALALFSSVPVLGARSALRYLTRRHCLSAENAANAASFAARPRPEHRSEVGASRPPQHEPLPGAACRDACTQHAKQTKRTTAMGR